MKQTALLLTALLTTSSALAEVSVSAPWVRGTVQGQNATGAYMTLSSSDEAALVEARSPVAGVVEIHTMIMEGDVMKMRPLPRLELPKGKPVELKPGGHHIMLMDLKKTLVQGEQLPLTLVVEGKDKQRRTIEIKAEVKALGAAPQKHDHKHDHSHDHKHDHKH